MLFIFEEITFQAKKNDKKSTAREFLILLEIEIPQNFFYFSKESVSSIFRNGNLEQMFYVSGRNFTSSKIKNFLAFTF